MGEKQPGRIGHGGVRRVVCFQAVTEADVVHMRTVTGGGAASVKLEQFRAANTFLGNSKAAFCSTFYAFDFVTTPIVISPISFRDERHAFYSKTTACTVSALPKAPEDE